MNIVRLRNGAQEAEPLVRTTMMILDNLLETKPIVAYELVMKCRDKNHKLFGQSGADLQNLSLVDANGGVHDSVRNIILSAAEGDGLNMQFVSPIAA